MHVEPKHIVTGAVMTVLLALFLFWQGDADGMDQQVVQIEQGAPDASQSEQAAKRQMAARYEKIRGMESQVAIEELRNPFSPAHEKRGEAVAEPTKNEAPQGKAAPSKKQEAARQQVALLPQEAGTAAEAGRVTTPAAQSVQAGTDGAKAVLALRGIVQGGVEPLVILSDGRTSQSLAVGERFLAYEVVEIGRTGVRLRGPEGEIWLTMASFS
ncbi:hypothetical protein [Mitsuokella multacida]|uniref:hypothetical protein n=1 Tax=Mitsuokella multacida TaxID=52226 RepID=UPI0024316A42|nr:hypothetical protein [Mitsuokella multacida]